MKPDKQTIGWNTTFCFCLALKCLFCKYTQRRSDRGQWNWTDLCDVQQICLKCVLCLCMLLRIRVTFLSTEFHVFSGLEMPDQSLDSHTAGPHHSLPCAGGSGNTRTLIHMRTNYFISRCSDLWIQPWCWRLWSWTEARPLMAECNKKISPSFPHYSFQYSNWKAVILTLLEVCLF